MSDIVKRLRAWGRLAPLVSDETYNKTEMKYGAQPRFDECADEIERLNAKVESLEAAIKAQANAVKILDRCKGTELAHLRKTHHEAKVAAKTLDSEREANAVLTAEIERLRAENARLREALGKAPSIAASFGEAFQGRNQSDYAQGYANACDTIEMVLTKLVSDTLAEQEETG